METVKELMDCLKEDIHPLHWWGLWIAILTHTPTKKMHLIPKESLEKQIPTQGFK